LAPARSIRYNLVRLSYRPRRAKAHLALVGKGITFGSGGLYLKGRDDMTTMKLDIAGAAAVVAATNAIAALKLPIRVTAYACLAENLPSGSALRPGDVLMMANDKTVEVLNTDAESRLIADSAGEPMWPLPNTSELADKVKESKVADLAQHNPKPVGGALFAAAFLREFVADGVSWRTLTSLGPRTTQASDMATRRMAGPEPVCAHSCDWLPTGRSALSPDHP
jgi:leucyl aminopeptidase